MSKNGGKMKKGILLILLFSLIFINASAYTFLDEFNANTLSNYGNQVDDLSINTELGWMNNTGEQIPTMFFYKNEKFGTGSYIWHYNYPYRGSMNSRYYYFIFGAQGFYSGSAYNQGIKYFVIMQEGTIGLFKTNNAGWEVIITAQNAASNTQGIHNITVYWNKDTGDMDLYYDEELFDTGNDVLISTNGYMGCGESNTIQLIDYDLFLYSNSTYIPSAPTVDFHAIPTNTEINLPIQFTDDSIGEKDTWYWEFGDGNISSDINPIYNYPNSGTYDINLTVCNVGLCNYEFKLWYISINVPVGPTPTPPISEINPRLIEKGETYIYWEWNKTGVNYTLLDGLPVKLNNGTYIYSNLLPNSKHILSISYDGINETSSIVTTNKKYDVFIWLIPLIGLILILGFKYSPMLPFIGFFIILMNLALNPNQFNDIEKIVNILFLIIALILFKFKFGDI